MSEPMTNEAGRIRMVKIGVYHIPIDALSFSYYELPNLFGGGTKIIMNVYIHGEPKLTIVNKDAIETMQELHKHYEYIYRLDKPLI